MMLFLLCRNNAGMYLQKDLLSATLGDQERTFEVIKLEIESREKFQLSISAKVNIWKTYRSMSPCNLTLTIGLHINFQY